MNLGEPWKPGKSGNKERQDKLLAKYFDQKGGLVFTEVNVAYLTHKSRKRSVDALRIPNPPSILGEGIYEYGDTNRHTIWELVNNYSSELIEVDKWGFGVFGDIVGKSEILNNILDPYRLNKTVIVKEENTILDGPGKQTEFNEQGEVQAKTEQGYVPDQATQAIFTDHNINTIILENL